jgi:hypothetical protein
MDPVMQSKNICPLCKFHWGEHARHCPTRFEKVEAQESHDQFVKRAVKAGPIKSDGGSSAYYELPEGATELNDLIEHRGMSFARGNIFKALYRLGEKAGVDVAYDLNKIGIFLDRLRKMNEEGKSL